MVTPITVFEVNGELFRDRGEAEAREQLLADLVTVEPFVKYYREKFSVNLRENEKLLIAHWEAYKRLPPRP